VGVGDGDGRVDRGMNEGGTGVWWMMLDGGRRVRVRGVPATGS
jgi:hypothetical protein